MIGAVFVTLVVLQVGAQVERGQPVEPAQPSLPDWIEGVWIQEQTKVVVQGNKSEMGVAKAPFVVFQNGRMLTVHRTRQYSKKLLAVTERGGKTFLMFKRPNDLPPMKFVAREVGDDVLLTSETRLRDGKKLQVSSRLSPLAKDKARERFRKEIDWDFADVKWFPRADRKTLESWLGMTLIEK